MSDDQDLIAITKAIMHAQHGQAVSDDEARGIVTLVLAGRDVANPAAYLRRALTQPDGGRYASPLSPPAPQPTAPPAPSETDLITMRKAEMIRSGEWAATAPERAARAKRGADLCRQMLADRPTPAGPAEPGGDELHGPALAAQQAAESRAHRDRLPAIVDVPLPDGEPADEPPDGDGEPADADPTDDQPPPGGGDEYPF